MAHSRSKFVGYPVPQKADPKDITYEWKDASNPVISGIPLAIGASIITSVSFLPKLLWNNAGFNGLRNLAPLSNQTERYDPTVIPLSDGKVAIPTASLTAARAFKSLPVDTRGRYNSSADYHALYLSGELTPLAVVQSLLPMIRRDIAPRDIHSVAFVDSNVEEILQAARASTQRYKDKASLGILDGIPVGIKDEVDVAGYRTLWGRKFDEKQPVKTETSWPVEMWEKCGAIVMGKMNMHEIGMDTTGNNPNWGTPKNPHNDEYYSGGSSSGSAYATAAGLLPITLGLDGGGSIRLPSSFCGVYGLKPSHGRVGDSGSSVTVIGPIAATISDIELAYRVMGTPDPSHPIATLFRQPQPLSERGKKVIGICEPWFDRADPLVQSRCRDVVDYLSNKHGYEVFQIDIPDLKEGQLAHAFTILAECASHNKQYSPPPRPWLTDLNPANKILMAVGAETPAGDYMLAQQQRNLLMRHLSFLYQQYPGMVIVTPTSPMAGWPIAHEGDLKYGISDGNKSMRNMEYIWIANLCGCPALSCPVGYVEPEKGSGNVPIGIMGMGEWGSEDALIEWGRDCETWLNEEYTGGRQKPGIWEDVITNAKGVMGIRV